MLKKGLTIFILLFSLLVAGTIFGYHYGNNLDLKGWWPLVLLGFGIYYVVYAIFFIAIDFIYPSSFDYVLRLHIFISIALLFLVVASFKLNIDWSAINDGRIRLTMWQKFLHEGLYIYIILISSLLTHLASRLIIRKK